MTQAPESGVPGLSFLKVINKSGNSKLSKLALETVAFSTGRAQLHTLNFLRYPLYCHTSYTGKKSPSSAATISVAAAAHTELMCTKEENLGE